MYTVNISSQLFDFGIKKNKLRTDVKNKKHSGFKLDELVNKLSLSAHMYNQKQHTGNEVMESGVLAESQGEASQRSSGRRQLLTFAEHTYFSEQQ